MTVKRTTLLISIALLVLLSGCGRNKEEVKVITERAREEVESGDYMGAVSAYTEALELTKDKKELYREIGIAYLGMEKYQLAIDSFIEALHAGNGFIKKADYDINLYLAKAYGLNGDYTQAVEIYDAVIDMKPKMLEAYYERGLAYLHLGNKSDALEDFEKVTAADPKNIDKYLDIFFSMEDAGFDDAARAYLKDTLDNAPGNTSDYDKGRMCYYLEDYSNARVYLEKAKDMSNPDTILMLGKTYEAINDFSYASSLYNSYLTEKGNNAGVYNQLGKCRMNMGDYEAALLAYSSGLNLDDANWNQILFYNEAVAYEYMLDFKTAYTKMKEYLDKYPKDEKAQRELIFLETRY